MSDIIIYTTPVCPYCVRAKQLFAQKKVSYTEIDVTHPKERDKMTERTKGKRTIPQIFIGDTYVGGCDDLYALEHKGTLDPLLESVKTARNK